MRRELLDHVIPLNERHFKRLAPEYLAYYHQDRTHIVLNKNTQERPKVVLFTIPNRIYVQARRSSSSLRLVGSGLKTRSNNLDDRQ